MGEFMIKDVITFGEAMGMLIAEEIGDLSEVKTFSKNMAGAETNVAIGLAMLGLKVGWIGKLGNDTFGRYIIETLKKEQVDVSNVPLENESVDVVVCCLSLWGSNWIDQLKEAKRILKPFGRIFIA